MTREARSRAQVIQLLALRALRLDRPQPKRRLLDRIIGFWGDTDGLDQAWDLVRNIRKSFDKAADYYQCGGDPTPYWVVGKEALAKIRAKFSAILSPKIKERLSEVEGLACRYAETGVTRDIAEKGIFYAGQVKRPETQRRHLERGQAAIEAALNGGVADRCVLEPLLEEIRSLLRELPARKAAKP